MASKKTIIIVSVLAVAGIGIWWYMKKKKAAAAAGTTPLTTIPASTSATPAPPAAGTATDPLASLRQQILAQTDPQYLASVQAKVQLMGQQDLTDMLALLTKQKAGAPFTAADQPALTRLQTNYNVFTATGKRNFSGLKMK